MRRRMAAPKVALVLQVGIARQIVCLRGREKIRVSVSLTSIRTAVLFVL